MPLLANIIVEVNVDKEVWDTLSDEDTEKLYEEKIEPVFEQIETLVRQTIKDVRFKVYVRI